MLMSLNREWEFETSRGGSTIEGCGAETSRLEMVPFISGVGATTACCNARLCFIVLFTSGAGAITLVGGTGSFKFEGESATVAAGIVGCGRAHATILGSATSWSNFRFGGVTIVCARLSASGGTEMIGCAASSGSPFFGEGDCVPPVFNGARYSAAS